MHTILDERDKMKFDEELKSIEDNVIVVSKSGEVLNVNDGANEPLKGLRVFGKTEQKTIPGNQLLKYPYVEQSNSKFGIDFTVNDDGSVSLKGTNENNDNAYFSFYLNTAGKRLNLKAGTYTFSILNSTKIMAGGNVVDSEDNKLLPNTIGITSNARQVSFTIDRDGELFLHCFVEPGVTVNETIYPMLNAGTTALPWEPYVGGIPSPNPLYPQELVSDGRDGNIEVGLYEKNLFKVIKGIIPSLNDGSDVSSSSDRVSSDFIRVDVSKNYTLSTTATYEIVYLLAYDINKNYLGYINANSEIFEKLKNSYPNLSYVRARYDVVSEGTFQFEVGSVTTEYRPYTKQSLAIQTPNGLPGIPVTDTSLATYTDENGQMYCADEKDYERGVYIQRVGVVKPDDWEKTNIADGTSGHRYRSFVPTIKGVRTPLLSNCYVAKSVSSFGTEGDYLSIDETSGGKVVIRTTDENLGTIDKFKAFANEKNLEVYYILETPIETPLSEEELNHYKTLKMNYPNTTILNDANAHMEVKYIADVQNHIEQNYVSKAEYEAAMSQVSMIETAML